MSDHGDLTRSTMMTTDESGSAVSGMTYTAFGEPVTYDAVAGWRVGFPADIGTRYGYDGGWGYESGLITLWGEDTDLPPVTLQHVGERWYQPGVGRFVQRPESGDTILIPRIGGHHTDSFRIGRIRIGGHHTDSYPESGDTILIP